MEKQPLARKTSPLILAAEIVERPLSWLWYPYLIGHGATLLYGRGGIGKSHITVDIAAALTKGTPLPGQTGAQPKRRVLMMSAEDEYDTVLVPRLRRAGADLSKIALPRKLFTLDAKGLKTVEQLIDLHQADLVVIDPIVHFMGGKVDMFKSNEVREVMGGLHQIGVLNETAILIVGHQRKAKAEENDIDAAMGSADFTNAPRSTLFVTHANDGTLVVRHAKHNYSPAGLSLPFEFDDDTFQWLEPFEEDEVQETKQVRKSRKPRQAAEAFIRTILAHGPVPAKEVELAAKDNEIASATLTRAKVGLAESFVKRENGKLIWYWELKDPKGAIKSHEISNLESREPPETPDGPKGDASSVLEPASGEGIDGIVPEMGRRRRASGQDQPQSARSDEEIAHEWLKTHGLL